MNRRSPAVIFALLLTVGLAQADPITFTGRAQIVDADTLRVEGAPKDVRLFGVDAPEKAQTCTDAAGARFLCGVKAAEAMSEILDRNPRVTCTVANIDRYGRLVSRCSSGALDISGELVRQGWALDFTRYSGGT